ncbi:MAG: hypothetical protein NTNFB02_28230 [Nitrospira sp.]
MLIIMDHCSIDVHGPHLADEAAESAITLRLGSGRVKHQKTRSPSGTAEIDISTRDVALAETYGPTQWDRNEAAREARSRSTGRIKTA